MAHVNGHAGHNGSEDSSLPAFPHGTVVEIAREAVQQQEKNSGLEAAGRDDKSAHQIDEWARVSRLAIKYLDRCVSLERQVLQGNKPEAIHGLRVATRRLQQVMDLVYPSPHSGEIRKIYRGLKRCRSALSEVRNYDVLLGRVDIALSRKRTARREAWEAIGDYLRELRSARFEKSLRKLAKANLSSIYLRLRECLPSNRGAAHEAVASGRNGKDVGLTSEQFYHRISENLKTLWSGLEKEISRSRHERGASVLHRTRITAKRVRYLIEVIHAFDVSGSKEALIWLRSFQTQLGDWHDLVVFEEAVIEMIADRDFLRDHLELAIQVERLVIRNRALKLKVEKQYFAMIRDRAGYAKMKDWVRAIVDSPEAQFAPP
ncbi:MAG TPA: CHAD domain-containing protein [Terriglobia bacterium]|nr:CHAD domain-containing protein [Terriglobia bacterium]